MIECDVCDNAEESAADELPLGWLVVKDDGVTVDVCSYACLVSWGTAKLHDEEHRWQAERERYEWEGPSIGVG